jgi:hypothetical protein
MCSWLHFAHTHVYNTQTQKTPTRVHTQTTGTHLQTYTRVHSRRHTYSTVQMCYCSHFCNYTHTHTHTPPHTNTHYNTRTHYIDMCTIQILHTTQKTHLHFAPTHTHKHTRTHTVEHTYTQHFWHVHNTNPAHNTKTHLHVYTHIYTRTYTP